MKKRMLGLAAAVAVAGSLMAAPASAGAGTATVNVVHGIPGAKVNVCVDGSSVADGFKYGNTIVGAALPAGMRNVKLVAAGSDCSASAILKETYDLEAGSNVTIVAALKPSGSPRLKEFNNRTGKVDAGMARLSVRHTAQAPAVNVWANGSPLIGGNDFVWGKSVTVMVPADSYRVKVTLPGETAPVIGPATLDLAAGKAYQVYAVGTADTYRLVVIKTNVGVR